ncbi:protein phosphatase 2C domain-containing protein [Actinoplanes sp. NPDC051411]|uniref:protein phosphatase 2C domain-containing protein n=1 Tax=Actinoplanes sp. NPDC051411 TaxID=3155522 RepID=UPI00342AFA61
MSEVVDWSGAPAVGVGGRAAAELPAGRPPGTPDSADHELSACAFPGVQVRAASVRGLLHRYRDQPRQDRYSLLHDVDSDTLVVTVCDGVGSLPRSQEAAAYVTRHMPHEYLASGSWATAVKQVNDGLARYAARRLDRAVAAGEDPEQHGMATTFVGMAIPLGGDRAASIAWTDDSSVWHLDEGRWTNLTAGSGDTGEETHRVSVRALPHREPRCRTAEVPTGRGAFFVVTDGVGVPLGDAAEVRDTLAGWWTTPPDVFTFGSQVAFARKSHLDDRTAVGIWYSVEA